MISNNDQIWLSKISETIDTLLEESEKNELLQPHSIKRAEQELQLAALKGDWQHVDEMLDLML